MRQWLYDESSSIWIKLYKGFAISLLWLMPILGFILLIRGFIVGAPGIGFLLFLIGTIGSFIVYVINMLLINLLYNVQRTRELVERTQSKP